MKHQVIGIIQARMGSTRLPGKTLTDILGKPLLQHVIERVQHSEIINKIVVATTNKRDDDAIIELCHRINIESYRGRESDVLDRFYQCAKNFKANMIIRVTADDPFKDPEIIDKAITELISDKSLHYVSNTIEPTYPEGIDIEAFTFNALEKAWRDATTQSDREHVTPYIWRHPKIFKLKNIKNVVDISDLRWTLDTLEDLKFTLEVYRRLYKPDRLFLMNDILSLLNQEPALSEINSGIERNAGYIKSMLEE
jgi:spore coat polysaccharide biosynthesis protein SpsF